jgi:SET domain-containing protein
MARRPPHDGVYARIGRSRIHGVGVLAIRDIPRGTRLFRGEDERVVWVRLARIRRLPVELRRLYTDFGMAWGQRIGVPRTLNMLSVGWYLNHSARPNTRCDEDGRFHALRRIRKGEELTADYRTFSDDDLTFRSMSDRRRKRPARSAHQRQRA